MPPRPEDYKDAAEFRDQGLCIQEVHSSKTSFCNVITEFGFYQNWELTNLDEAADIFTRVIAPRSTCKHVILNRKDVMARF